MDKFFIDNHFFRSNVVCCESLVKLKHYVNILQFESCRLSTLQLECNQLLDQFYTLKDEFEFLTNEAPPIKYIGTDIHSFNEYVYEFMLFVRKIWQVGKHRFSEKAKKPHYDSIIGSRLSDVMLTIQSFVEEVQNSLMHTPSHSECAVAIQTICYQIHVELQDECLGSAETCLKQYLYLKSANPFLQELIGIIQHYLTLPDVHTPKQFVDKVILNIPSVDVDLVKTDSEEMASFRFVIDLLNGKLLDKDVLDHNSDIRPIIEDDVIMKNSVLVLKTVEWITAQYMVTDAHNILMNASTSIIPFELIDRNNVGHSYKYTYGRQFFTQSPQKINYTFGEFVDQYDMNFETMSRVDLPMVRGSPMYTQRKYSPRRARKYGSKNIEVNASDLQPIDIQSLQTPLLSPLL